MVGGNSFTRAPFYVYVVIPAYVDCNQVYLAQLKHEEGTAGVCALWMHQHLPAAYLIASLTASTTAYSSTTHTWNFSQQAIAPHDLGGNKGGLDFYTQHTKPMFKYSSSHGPSIVSNEYCRWPATVLVHSLGTMRLTRACHGPMAPVGPGRTDLTIAMGWADDFENVMRRTGPRILKIKGAEPGISENVMGRVGPRPIL